MKLDSRFGRPLVILAFVAAGVAGHPRVAAAQTIEAVARAVTADTFGPGGSTISLEPVSQDATAPQEPAQTGSKPPEQSKGKARKPADTGTEEVVVLTRSAENTGFKALVRNTLGDFKALPSNDSAITLGVGGGAAWALSGLDDSVNEYFQDSGLSHAFWQPGKYIGLGEVQIGAAIGTWAIGHWKDPHGWLAHLGLDLLRAQIVTQTITYGLKVTTQRERPDGSDGYSFPSGHASTTFATATVLQRHLGLKAALPTYAIATYVAFSRLYEDRHHLSDVAFGATVGLIAGRTVTRHGRNNYAMVPMVVPGGLGVAVTRVGW
jgi:membrane-associated phospholipid phosphatase